MNWFGGGIARNEIHSSIQRWLVRVFCVTILLAPALTHSNPYLAKPGEAPVSVYVSTCAVTGGFIHLYTALDQKIFEKYGIHVKHVVIQRRDQCQFGGGMGRTTNSHWTQPLPTEKFSGKGYVPQALTHGTLENEDLEASERFYREVLGLEVVKLWPSSCYVKHSATPWYVVCIQALKSNRQHLSRYQRLLCQSPRPMPYTKLISHLKLIAGLGESKISKRSKPRARSLPFSSATSTATGGRLRAQEHSQAPNAIAAEAAHSPIWSGLG